VPLKYKRSLDLPFQKTTGRTICAAVESLEPRRMLSGSIASIAWSAYLGGSFDDGGEAITTDPAGNILVTGRTASPDFDAATNGTKAGPSPLVEFHYDGFVAKLNPSGALLWAKYLGGSEAGGTQIASDGDGNTLITRSHGIGYVELMKLNSSGDTLWSINLGGSDAEESLGLRIDAEGNALVIGWTDSNDFVGANNSYHGGEADGFIAKISGSGDLVWATYLGGSDWDNSGAITLDHDGSAYVSGGTRSVDLAAAGNDYRGEDGAFLAKIGSGGQLLWAKYLDTKIGDVRALALSASGNVIVAGKIWIKNTPGEIYSFLANVGNNGDLLWSTYLGGGFEDASASVVINARDEVLVVGRTSSTNLSAALNNTYGGTDGFVAKVNASGAVMWSMYVGGSSPDWLAGITLDSDGNALMVGGGASNDLQGAINTSHGAGGIRNDVYVVKLIVEKAITGTVGNDDIRVSEAALADPMTGETIQGVQVAINGKVGDALLPEGPLTIYGLGGDDTITVDADVSFPVIVYGGDGNDTITGGAGDDLLYGGEGNDVFSGGTGNDTIYGNRGADTLSGGTGDDQIFGGIGRDAINGGDGDDSLLGGNGMDLIRGGAGYDSIEGKGKADTLYGGDGNDTILGQAGNDLIYGQAGDDWIYVGDSGTLAFRDTVRAGAGNDRVNWDASDTVLEKEIDILA